MSLNASTMPFNAVRHLQNYRDDWQNLISRQSNNSHQSDRMSRLRQIGWSEFERIGFPTHRRGNELWKYTDLREIDRQAFRFGTKSSKTDRDALENLTPLPAEWHNVVFVDGVLDRSISDPLERTNGIDLASVADYDGLGMLAECADNAFVALNSAFLADGIHVDVQDGAAADVPIHVVFVTTASTAAPRAVYPRLVISVGSDAETTLIESHVSLSDDEYLTAPVVEISLARNASIKHYRVQQDSENAYHFATTRVEQGEGSAYNSTSFSVGSSIGRNDVFTLLDGEYATSTLHGVYLTTNRQHQDNEISTTHAAPHCTSDQYYKGILSGRSRAVFSGKITVERGAQKTDANQKDLNLLLSHGAEVDTKPSLEIYADDVKCGHGATAGFVDEDTLFYLQSRGVDYDTAQAMLIRGFAAEILEEFEDDVLREFLESQLDDLMPALQASSDTIGTA